MEEIKTKKKKTLEERLAESKPAPEIQSIKAPEGTIENPHTEGLVNVVFNQVDVPKESGEVVMVADGMPKDSYPTQGCNCNNQVAFDENAYQAAAIRERVLQCASFIMQGIYANSGVPRRVMTANANAFEYLTGEAMDKAMKQRAEFAIKQARILMELV